MVPCQLVMCISDMGDAGTQSRLGPILELVGGAVLLAGSALAWASLTTVFGTASVPGTESDGLIAMAVGGLICLLAILELGSPYDTRTAAMFAAIAVGVLGVYEWVSIRERVLEVSSEFARASVGVGLYAVIAGACLAFAEAADVATWPQASRSPRPGRQQFSSVTTCDDAGGIDSAIARISLRVSHPYMP
jgi:hypothetical protein